jgi:hypothetical protein
MATNIEKGKEVSPLYADMFKSLMRFGSLATILPEKGRRDALVQYYETVKSLQGCRTNPLFWLQYAIASLVSEDLPRAKTYFDTAYALAIKRGWNTFQIDNHFARYLMVQAVREDDVQMAWEKYREAAAIIDRQILSDRRHYPYRVAVYLQDFINKFGSRMDATNRSELAMTAERILQRILQLPSHIRHHRHVMNCEKAMTYVLSVCRSTFGNA